MVVISFGLLISSNGIIAINLNAEFFRIMELPD